MTPRLSHCRVLRSTLSRGARGALVGPLTAMLAIALWAYPLQADPGQLDFDAVFAEHPSGQVPSSTAFSPAGDRLAFLWPDNTLNSIWIIDLDVGADRGFTLEGSMPEPEAFQWSPDGGSLLVEAEGDLYLVDTTSTESRRLTETSADETNPRFSPDGSRLAYVRDANLYLLELATGLESPLTTDGEENLILNGTTSWVYWEEIWGREDSGFWWSPDGTRIAYYRFDESDVPSYPLLNSLPVYPEVDWQRYPKAGQANPRVRVGVLDIATGETAWMKTDTTREVYLARVHWRPGDAGLAIERLHREQDRLDLLTCDPASGDCATLLTEEWPTWVNLGDETTFLDDGRILWSSERSGWRRLYDLEPDGELRALTPENLVVTSLDHATDDWIQFTAFKRGELGAAHRSVHRLSLEDGRHEELAGGEGWNEVGAVGATGLWVHTWSALNTPTQSAVLDRSGRTIAGLPATAPLFDPATLPAWRLLTIPGPDGEPLPAQLLEPARNGTADDRYPVIMYHYGGPASQVVANRWGTRGRALWHKMMAERGFGVLSVDNGGSIFFGKRGGDRLHRRFGEINLAAQRAGVAYLTTLPWVDPDRIALWGWSGGGANTLYSVLNSPGTWAAAVAGAPVTEWHLYDTIWTERYLDHPDDNPDGYEASSSTTYAANLQDPLLIVHGTADDNVHPQNSLVMSQKLIESGVPFEQALYPRQKHGFRGDSTRHFYERMTAFIERTLATRD